MKPGNLETNKVLRDLRPRPRCKWDLRPFGVLRCVNLQNSADFKAVFFGKLGTVGYKSVFMLLFCPTRDKPNRFQATMSILRN